MKTRIQSLLVGLALLPALNLQFSAFGQNTVVTFQGYVQSGGSGFTGTGQFKFTLVTSTNTATTATATANLSGTFVTGYTLTYGGSGYVTAPAVSVTGGGGSGATATAVISGGVVTAINPGQAGSGYTSPPTVTIAPPPVNIVYTTYWNNDGTVGSEPAAAVGLPVNNGLFSARLGDSALANMTALPPGLFQQPNLQLRIWFNDGVNGFAVLNPAQPLSAAPYAFMSGGLTTPVSAAQIGPDAVTSTAILDGTIQGEDLGYIYRLSVAAEVGINRDAGGLFLGSIAGWYSDIDHNVYYDNGWRNKAMGPGTRVAISGGVNTPSEFAVQVSPLPTNAPAGSDAGLMYDAFKVIANGNVGIGVTSPAYKLDVNGNVRAAGIYASGSVSADGAVHGVNLSDSTLKLAGQRWRPVFGGEDAAIEFAYNPLSIGQPTVYTRLRSHDRTVTIECDALVITNVSSYSGGAYPLYIAANGTLMKNTSSRRYKDRIEPLGQDSSRILSLEAKQYVRKDNPDTLEIGYIAEDLDKLGLAGVVVRDAQGLPDGVDYARIVIYANEVLKDQQKRLQSQQTEIESLKGELEALKPLIRQLSQPQR